MLDELMHLSVDELLGKDGHAIVIWADNDILSFAVSGCLENKPIEIAGLLEVVKGTMISSHAARIVDAPGGKND